MRVVKLVKAMQGARHGRGLLKLAHAICTMVVPVRQTQITTLELAVLVLHHRRRLRHHLRHHRLRHRRMDRQAS